MSHICFNPVDTNILYISSEGKPIESEKPVKTKRFSKKKTKAESVNYRSMLYEYNIKYGF